jgi:hypothetical protein
MRPGGEGSSWRKADFRADRHFAGGKFETQEACRSSHSNSGRYVLFCGRKETFDRSQGINGWNTFAGLDV